MGGSGKPLNGGQNINREETGSWLDGLLNGESEYTRLFNLETHLGAVPGVKAQQAKRSTSVLFSK
jgi:hypothetical protein